ncbi:hypothetical protein ASPZODRAFT_126294 [Penicilliopsis zonata CBS 506.65]|uniref:DASH complex subunit DAD2 n=1 Tax=Penicilliopsis zonata CBS 506.65 TaxID=1073090 RepID=A0A1L9STM8_9EURO|nr:hypothetical protein ASPZODRAFT_126294 [Penicilliopsis zonata CBS 506.65]OJJ50433.1 hypothetical protein ASPZODRAFT_126294 [Penicilliopsis zonata CBS 506.65]
MQAPTFSSHTTSSSSFRQANSNNNPQHHSSLLEARVSAKKAELDNLKELRDLSDALATQMQVLENKLVTLNDGTKAVAYVLANWENVLQTIHMASSILAKKSSPAEGGPVSKQTESPQPLTSLPATLVRVPIEHVENISN